MSASNLPPDPSQGKVPPYPPPALIEFTPAGGFSGMFKVHGLPTELKISYWIWIFGGLLNVLSGLLLLPVGYGYLSMGTNPPGTIFVGLLPVILSLVVAAAQILLATKMKQGKGWARVALSAILVISVIPPPFGLIGLSGIWGGSLAGLIIRLVATALLWLPNSQAWFSRIKRRA
ncbi:hypothetical protein [Specibacter cremeus]|uniref:hypothetical protein n=1 Tax=Specibacter cremeus TaxID=1629051 RepID=UPI001F0B724F|nr:hypothetical protein [Specibacter cremeus]